jgi:acetylserotonin N-methyltransferase
MNPAPIIDLIEAFRRSKTMFAAVELGIFDLTPADLPTLGERLAANADSLERLLDGCVGLGLLERDGSVFRNTEIAARYLRRDSPDALTGYILYSNNVLFNMWSHLEDAVKEGTNRWAQTFGSDEPIFAHFFKTDEAMRTFLKGMHGLGTLSSPPVIAAFDLSGFGRMVDLGGATGHLALAAAEKYPALRAAVFDLPRVIEHAAQHADPKRVEFIAGDFFEDPLPEADLYALGRILHDWGEPKIKLLLRKIFDALPAGGGLLIAEKLIAPDRSGPVSAHMQSLNMLICTEGKERTAAEYAILLRAAGFTSVESHVTGAPLDAVLARKS